MCTALLSIEPGRPALLVGVRDELASRAWQPPARHWPGRPALVGGRDLQAGGTWLAVSPPDRRAACVLNSLGQPAPAAARRSRGALPLAAAAGETLDRSALARFDPFHLVTVVPDGAIAQSWDGEALTERELDPGLHFAVNSGWAAGLKAAAGRPHELARIAYFLPRFLAAARPDPMPGQPVAQAWDEWLPLLNGDGIATDDDRALIVRRDLGDGRIWGTSSISLVALTSGGFRYDFTSAPGDPAAWTAVR
jgi:Transport and Golgi organisation 2